MAKPIYNDVEGKGTVDEITTFCLVFDHDTDHYSFVEQFVRKAVKNKYAGRKEVIQALQEYLAA